MTAPKSPTQRASTAPAVVEATVQQLCTFEGVLAVPTLADCKAPKQPRNLSEPYSALVDVRAVFKGASSSFKGPLLISGFGPEALCMNDVQPGKTYIFFLSTLQGQLIAAHYDGKFSAALPATATNRKAVSLDQVQLLAQQQHEQKLRTSSTTARRLLQVFGALPGQGAPAACQQPKVVGPCRAAVQQFYFDPASGTCEVFIYGGCQGNDNRFPTRQACEVLCTTTGRSAGLGPAPAPAPAAAAARVQTLRNV